LVIQHEQALANNDRETAAGANRQFHQFIIQKAGNQRLVQILANLEDHLQRYRLLAAYQVGRPQKSASEHRQVLIAFEQHDGPAAAVALSAHLLSVLEDLTRQDLADLVARARQGDRPTTQHNAHQE